MELKFNTYRFGTEKDDFIIHYHKISTFEHPDYVIDIEKTRANNEVIIKSYSEKYRFSYIMFNEEREYDYRVISTYVKTLKNKLKY